MPLLTALCALLALGSCFLAWKLVRGPVAERALLVVVALPLVAPGWSLRPQAFTMFLLMTAVHLVVRERFLLLPPLFCLWANLHGAVALGLVVLVADFAAALVSRCEWRRPCRVRPTLFRSYIADAPRACFMARGVAVGESLVGEPDCRVDAPGPLSGVRVVLDAAAVIIGLW